MALLIKPLSDESFAGTFLVPLGEGSYSVGRREENDLTIRHDSISGLHARIEASRTNGVDVIDCGSSNGTFVNGEKIERRALKPGDTIRFASASFRVEEEAAVPNLEQEKQIETLSDELMLVKRQRERDEADAAARIEKLSQELSAARAEVLEKEKLLATLQFEVSRRDTTIQQQENKLHATETGLAEWQAAHTALASSTNELEENLRAAQAAAAAHLASFDDWCSRLDALSRGWREDWSYWLSPSETEDEEGDSIEALDSLRRSLRRQLDLMEPVWKEFGEGVQRELRGRCEKLEERIAALTGEHREKQEELLSLRDELAKIREEVDREVRRAQGLSRRSVAVEIPERFESMVIARDREREIFLALIEQVEFFERLLEGYRRSKQMKTAIFELEDFRKRLLAILEANGVEAFEVEPGLILTLKHRRDVKVFGKKGWGTREFVEQPFQPGKVVKVIRCGYRAGTGEGMVILRKVEVLIQEAEG